jgi:hypothetical protein
MIPRAGACRAIGTLAIEDVSQRLFAVSRNGRNAKLPQIGMFSALVPVFRVNCVSKPSFFRAMYAACTAANVGEVDPCYAATTPCEASRGLFAPKPRAWGVGTFTKIEARPIPTTVDDGRPFRPFDF